MLSRCLLEKRHIPQATPPSYHSSSSDFVTIALLIVDETPEPHTMCRYFEDRKCPSCQSLWVEPIESPLEEDECACEGRVFFTYDVGHEDKPEQHTCPVCKIYGQDDEHEVEEERERAGQSDWEDTPEQQYMSRNRLDRIKKWTEDINSQDQESPAAGSPDPVDVDKRIPNVQVENGPPAPIRQLLACLEPDSNSSGKRCREDNNMIQRLQLGSIITGSSLRNINASSHVLRPMSPKQRERAKRALEGRIQDTEEANAVQECAEVLILEQEKKRKKRKNKESAILLTKED